MSWHNKNPLQDPLARVRGLGSAREGVSHWWSQRVTAISLIFLGIWFLWFIQSLLPYSTPESVQFGVFVLLKSPLNVAFLISFIAVACYHAFLGLQVIIEDYINHESTKWGFLLFSKLLFSIAGISGVVAVLGIAL